MAVSFFVNRLYVRTAEGKVAYDEPFHHGVNIIRGDNSSGKSTITHLLFYGLGGDYTQFVQEARHCSQVMVEVSLDQATITLSRSIDKDAEGRVLTQRGMTIYWGTLDEALQGECESGTFGYKSTANSRSFSNVLFDIMRMPIVQGDSNITMHQLLRLLYIDQESPTTSLYYYEQFDNQTTRETVADLLLGIFEEKLYHAKMRKKELEAELSEVKSDIRALGNSLDVKQCSTAYIQGEIDQKNKEQEELAEKIKQLRQGEQAVKQDKSQLERCKAEMRRLEKQCEQEEERIDLLQYDIEDTQMFVEEMSRKQLALNHSVSTREILGNLRLEYCPECLSPLPQNTPEGTCHLCRQKVDNHSGVTQAKRLIAELSFQKMESEAILRKDEDELSASKAKLKRLKAQRKVVQRNLDELLGNVRSTTAAEIEDLIYQKGQLNGVYFLNHDEKRQRDFTDAQPSDLTVDFPNNMVFLKDRYAKYSASSAFFLKLVARFSLFFASLDIDWMRYPRFIFADNMEDKGIEQHRAQLFQETLIDRLQQYDTDSYQVIYTTSYITPELDHSEYVVGEHYDINHKSLKNVRKNEAGFDGQ